MERSDKNEDRVGSGVFRVDVLDAETYASKPGRRAAVALGSLAPTVTALLEE